MASNWAVFYRYDLKGNLTEAVGGDSIIYLDGRFSYDRCYTEAVAVARKRGFDGFRIARGAHIRTMHFRDSRIQKVAHVA